jgi:hypothetical protein
MHTKCNEKSAESDDIAHAINKNNFRSNKFFNNRRRRHGDASDVDNVNISL